MLVENLLLWTRDSKNKLLFVERPEKTQLFLTPERFLLGPSDRSSSEYDDHSRNILLEEFFSSSNVGVPEVIINIIDFIECNIPKILRSFGVFSCS